MTCISKPHVSDRGLSTGRKVLWLLIVIASVVRFFNGIYKNPIDHLFSDPQRHWENALRFLNPGLMNGCDPIFYQIYLFGLQKVTNCNHLAIGLATGLLSAAMPWTYYRASRSFPEMSNHALIAWALMAITPSFFVIYRYFMIETVLLPLIGLGLWATGRFLRKRDYLAFAIMVGVWGIASLTKPVAIPLALICIGYGWWRADEKSWCACVGLVISLVIIIPNGVRTYKILGFTAPFGSGWIAQIMHTGGTKHTRFHWENGTWIYSSPSCYIYPLHPLNHWAIERAYSDTVRDITLSRSNGKKDWQDAYEKCNTGVSVRFFQWGENIILFLFAPSWPDSGLDSWAGTINYWSRWMWGPLIFYVLFGNWEIFKTRWLPLIPLATTSLLLLLIFQNSVTIEGRYRKPLEPLLLLNAIWLCVPRAENRIMPFRKPEKHYN